MTRALFCIPLFDCLGFWPSAVSFTAADFYMRTLKPMLAPRCFEPGFDGDIFDAGGELGCLEIASKFNLYMDILLETEWVEDIQIVHVIRWRKHSNHSGWGKI